VNQSQVRDMAELALSEREKDVASLRAALAEAESNWQEDKKAAALQLEQANAGAQQQLAVLQAEGAAQAERAAAAERQLAEAAANAQARQESPPALILGNDEGGGIGAAHTGAGVAATTAGAAAGAAAGGGSGSLSVMEVFGQLQEKDAQWRSEKAERQRLELNLDAILKELERKVTHIMFVYAPEEERPLFSFRLLVTISTSSSPY
jgi:DNA repair exonuclease SbcCD ATPase subunit